MHRSAVGQDQFSVGVFGRTHISYQRGRGTASAAVAAGSGGAQSIVTGFVRPEVIDSGLDVLTKRGGSIGKVDHRLIGGVADQGLVEQIAFVVLVVIAIGARSVFDERVVIDERVILEGAAIGASVAVGVPVFVLDVAADEHDVFETGGQCFMVCRKRNALGGCGSLGVVDRLEYRVEVERLVVGFSVHAIGVGLDGGPDGSAHGRGVAVPVGRRDGQAVLDDIDHASRCQSGHLCQEILARLVSGPGATGDQRRQDEGERVDVGRRGAFRPIGCRLGSDKACSAVVKAPGCNTERGDDRRADRFQVDVGRAKVAMHHLLVVGEADNSGDFSDDLGRQIPRRRPMGHLILKVAEWVVRRDDVVSAIAGDAVGEHRHEADLAFGEDPKLFASAVETLGQDRFFRPVEEFDDHLRARLQVPSAQDRITRVIQYGDCFKSGDSQIGCASHTNCLLAAHGPSLGATVQLRGVDLHLVDHCSPTGVTDPTLGGAVSP